MQTDAPEILCPECGHRYSDASYFEMGVGSESECPKCGATIVVEEVEMRMRWSFVTEQAYKDQQARHAERVKQGAQMLSDARANRESSR